jgi:hypothetical protein
MRSDRTADHSFQVAENQKRHGLNSLEMARFIRAPVEAGYSNATIAWQLGMNLTTVSHHLSLLGLPLVRRLLAVAQSVIGTRLNSESAATSRVRSCFCLAIWPKRSRVARCKTHFDPCRFLCRYF